MKYWCFNDYWLDEDGNINSYIVTKSEEEILKEYYDYWCQRMKEVGKEDQIHPKDCIDNWVIVNWAWESKD